MPAQQKKPIARASDQELRDFAEVTLQIDLTGTADRAGILAKIKAAWPPEFIYVEEAELGEAAKEQDDAARAEAQQKVGGNRYQDDPKCLVVITATELPGGKDPVPVGVNGDIVAINRGMEVDLPYRFLGAIRDAVRVSVTQDPKTQEFSYSSFTNYPLQIIQMPSRQEIEEFRERTKDLLLT